MGEDPIVVEAAKVFDSLGRVVEESQTVGAGDAEFVTTSFTGRRRSAMIYPNGRTVYYGYHDSGALDQISDNADLSDPIARYDYIGGRTLMRRMQNGIHLDLARRDASGSPTGYSWYDTLGRPEKWAWGDTLHTNPSGAATLKIGFEYGYDRAGNKTKQDSLHDPKDNQTYRYDSTGRLVGYDRGDASGQTWPEMASARDYMLDGLGNWDWVKTLTGGTTVTQVRNHTTFNEIATWDDGASSGTLGHDDNGNMLEKDDFELTWDAFNRMSMADDLDVNPSGTSIRYVYDTGNRRVAIVKTNLSESTTVYDLFLYGDWQVLEERETSSLETNVSSTLNRQFVYGNYIDEPLVMDTNEDSDISCVGSADSRLFYHQNTLFSVYALTDADGNLVEAYAYDPYGKHVVIGDGDADGKVEFDSSDIRTLMSESLKKNPFIFSGQRFMKSLSLLYNVNRCYDPSVGRWISRDPLVKMYLYQYCSSSPTSSIDILGLIDWDVTANAPNAFEFDEDEYSHNSFRFPSTAAGKEAYSALVSYLRFAASATTALIFINEPAARHLAHYLGNTGNTKNFDAAEMLKKDKGARQEVVKATRELITQIKDGSITLSSEGVTRIAGHPDKPVFKKGKFCGPQEATGGKWGVAVGGFWLRGTANVLCQPDNTKSLNVRYEIQDYYNFHDHGPPAGPPAFKHLGVRLMPDLLQMLSAYGLAAPYILDGGEHVIIIHNIDYVTDDEIEKKVKGLKE